MQQQIWFHEQLEPQSPLYTIPLAYDLIGSLDVATLQRALQMIVNRHPSFRTSFIESDGTPQQIIASQASCNLVMTDIAHLEAAECDKICTQKLTEVLRTGFDITQGPLIRAHLIRTSATRHLLAINLHHLIFDGWSINIFHQELAHFYRHFQSGIDTTLPIPAVNYVDIVQWQYEQLSQDLLKVQQMHWMEELGGELPQLELFPDFVRPPTQAYRGSCQSLPLSADLTQQLRRLAQQHGITLYMLVLTSLVTLLHRYTHQTDIIIGTPIAGRTQPEMEQVIGYLVNMVVLRFNLDEPLFFVDLLKQAKEKVLQAHSHQDYPFRLLVEKLNPERDPSRSPIFQTIFTYQEHKQDLQLENLQVKSVPVPPETVKFDTSFGIVEADGVLHLEIEYRKDLFLSATIQQLLKHWQQLLQSIVDNSYAELKALPRLNREEYHTLITQVNPNSQPLPPDICVHQLVEAHAALRPTQIAVCFGEKSITYEELNCQANQLARWLRNQGVGPDAIAVLLLDQSIEIIVAMLAVLKAGGAYMPLDGSYPQLRLKYMIEDAQPAVILSMSHLGHLLPDHQEKCFFLDTQWHEVANLGTTNLPSLTTSENLVNVLYTSGSTGTPKGVALPHRGVIRLVHQPNFAAMDHTEVVPQLSPLNFDGATYEIWATLCNGGQLVIIQKEIVLAPRELSAAIYKYCVTTLLVTTPLLNRLIEDAPEALTPLRQVIFGGEIISKPHIKKALQYCQPGTLTHTYGPTENSFTSCYYPIHTVDDQQWTIPIGTPVSHTAIYILDQQLGPVPYGVIGEVYLGGLGLARGYINDPIKTTQNFLPNPFSTEPGARMYKTGDRARRRQDGYIEFISRNDNQIKIRSQRLELAEVESALRQSPLLTECFVNVVPDEQGSKQLVAYFVPSSAKTDQGGGVQVLSLSNDEISSLRAFLKELLPDYMVPTHLIPLSALPLNPNGKVNRKALPKLTAIVRQEHINLPQTQLERVIAQIWQQVLSVQQIGIDDNFFDIGGHSLLLVKVHDALKRQLLMTNPLMDLFKYPTVRSLAKALGSPDISTQPSTPLFIGTNQVQENVAIAIVGMALRFPKADTPYEFWQNLRVGRECVTMLSDDQLETSPLNTNPRLLDHLVRAGGFVDHPFDFDPGFFHISEREALQMDPQHRLFLMCLWEAIENAG